MSGKRAAPRRRRLGRDRTPAAPRPEAPTPVGGPTPEPARPAPRTATPSRRGPATLLAVVLPVATLAAGLLVAPDAPEEAPAAAPAATTLAEQTLVCPPPPASGAAPVVVGREPAGDGGAVSVTGLGGEPVEEDLDVPAGGAVGPVLVPGAPAALSAEGDAAAGLLGGRFGEEAVTGTACEPTAADQWFTGLSAGPERSSVVELVNPAAGDAVADVTLLGPDGPLDVPDVEGVTVPAGERVSLDLGALTPTADDLAARVEVVRGRVAASVLDTATPIGGTEVSEWLPRQSAPATTSLLPGLVGGEGPRTLVVANPGAADTQVEVDVVTPTGAVRPTGVRTLQVPAGGVETVGLSEQLAAQVDQGAGGVLLRSADPVTATLRGEVRGDLTYAVPVDPATTGAALLPAGESRVLLTADPDAGSPSTATVTARDADGEEVASEEVEVVPGGLGEVAVPEGAVAVSVVSDGEVAAAVVVLRGEGNVVLPVRPAVTEALVAQVRPGLP
ncbi:DUF5719 family protein [Nocardioides sp. CFH 31398]|uniref:DUF5719 family protein n=1 Tax=Nocardioides sp. CFH 31398 TaxID=2919579 RepID=UPI001F06E5EE|nr:DUF5719 family protein [Nocardioides sp. CFH 31398]MCH1866441.1 DUF5719 family protein [Nocardioides sp. CFH 31398]